MPYTREQIDAITIGTTFVAQGLNGIHYGEPTPVVEIFAKDDDCDGKLFVCGYRKFGETSRISFSVKEGDATDSRCYRIIPLPEGWTWERVVAERAKWDIDDNMIPIAIVPGACVGWGTINSVLNQRKAA